MVVPLDPGSVLAAYGLTEADLARIVARRTRAGPSLDGRLDEAAWAGADWSGRFVDMVSGVPGLYDTRVAALWDDEALYVGYRVEEPFVRGRLTERDDLIWYDDDVELFIAGPDAYYEIEVNALGTIYEVLHLWADACVPGGPFDRPEFDPRRRDARGFTGNGDPEHWDWDGLHPRGNRWSFLDWDLPGLGAAVHVDGTLNDDRDVDRGWTVALALPWAGLAVIAGHDLPPRAGNEWRCCFARFKNLEVNGRRILPTAGWTLNRHGRYDIHVPEAFSLLTLSDELAG